MEYMYQAVIGLLMLAAMGWLMSRKLKLAGAAPLALMIVMLLSIAQPGVVAAATVSKTFTTHTQVSAALLVYGGETFTFNVSGTFVGTVKLQKSLNGSAWENVISTNAAYSRTIYADAGKGQREYYRVFASTHTSGSIVTAIQCAFAWSRRSPTSATWSRRLTTPRARSSSSSTMTASSPTCRLACPRARRRDSPPASWACSRPRTGRRTTRRATRSTTQRSTRWR